MKFIGLDSVDEAILNLLIQNARASYTDIACLLYTSDAADEQRGVDIGSCRINKKKTKKKQSRR